MERLQQQVAVVSEELAAIKSELINVKAAHAGLHQSSVESNTNTTRTLSEVIARIEGIEGKGPVYSGAPTRKALIEPKQMEVDNPPPKGKEGEGETQPQPIQYA